LVGHSQLTGIDFDASNELAGSAESDSNGGEAPTWASRVRRSKASGFRHEPYFAVCESRRKPSLFW